MKVYLTRLLLFFIPFILILLSYIIIDPYKVLYKYDEYYNTDRNYQVTLNRDYICTQLFLENYKKYNYNSFILGNSRSIFYQADYWSHFVQGNPFHFDASSETLYGIYTKVKFLDKLHVPIKNVIIVLDNAVLAKTENSEGLLYRKHPKVSGEWPLAFHAELFRSYATSRSMLAFMELYVTKRSRPYMRVFGVLGNVWKHDTKTNQLTYDVYDKQIAADPEAYYSSKKGLFYKRDSIQQYQPDVIAARQKEMLLEIKSVFARQHTNFKIIINPAYDQSKLGRADLSALEQIFGKENVFDFSGKNRFTDDYRNYYEPSHYRPPVCDSIMNIIYGASTLEGN